MSDFYKYNGDQKIFTDIFDSYDTFKTNFNDTVFSGVISDKQLETLFYLLYARYGNSTIAGYDVNQWEYRLYAIIYQYAPSFFKRREIQEEIIKMDLNGDEILKGARMVHNTALNPGNAPGTANNDELDYINSQDTSNYRSSKVDALAKLSTIIRMDTMKELLDKFKDLFIKVLAPYKPILYKTEEDDSNE